MATRSAFLASASRLTPAELVPLPPPPIGNVDSDAAVLVNFASAATGSVVNPASSYAGNATATLNQFQSSAAGTVAHPSSAYNGNAAASLSLQAAAGGTTSQPGTKIFELTGFTKANWDSYLGSLTTQYPVENPTRKAGHNSQQLTLPNSHKIFCGHNHEATQALDNDTIVHERFDLGTNPTSGQKHTLVVVQGTSLAFDYVYLKPKRNYEINFRYELIDDVLSLSDYRDNSKVPWLVVGQLWNPNPPGGQAPVNLIIDQQGGTGDNVLLARINGSTQLSPTSYTTQSETKVSDVTLGQHSVKIQTYWNWAGPGSHMKIYHDGVLAVNVTQEIGVNRAGYLFPNSMAFFYGLYSSGDTLIGAKVHTTTDTVIYEN